MKKNKILSVILSGIMMICGMGSATVNADDSEYYTFSELINMSDREFLELENAQKDYEKFKELTEKFGYMRFNFSVSTIGEDSYQYYYSEKKICELLGDEVEFEMISPVTATEDNYYSWILKVWNDDMVYNLSDITDADYIYISKLYYCLKQVCNIYYNALNTALLSPNVVYGDINSDKLINVRDAAMLAKNIASNKIDELNINTADFNFDGKVNVRDCAEIAKFVLAKNLAETEGF